MNVRRIGGLILDRRITLRMVDVRVGEEVRRLREKKGLTLRGLAAKMGVSAPFLSDVEHGRRSLWKRLDQAAKLLGTTVDHFAEICGVCPTCGGSGLNKSVDPK